MQLDDVQRRPGMLQIRCHPPSTILSHLDLLQPQLFHGWFCHHTGYHGVGHYWGGSRHVFEMEIYHEGQFHDGEFCRPVDVCFVFIFSRYEPQDVHERYSNTKFKTLVSME